MANSNTEADDVAKKVRGPHEVRKREMRDRLIKGAIDCLYREGYGGTTTLAVQRRTKVSRGALLHHFPTRADLLIAVAKNIIGQQTKFYLNELRKLPDDRARYVGIIGIAWRALCKPSGLALLELLVGTRSDPEIASRFDCVSRELEQFQRSGMWLLARNAGVADRAAVRTANDLALATLRGLSIQKLHDSTPDAADAGVTMLIEWTENWLEKLVPMGSREPTSTPIKVVALNL